MLAPVTLPVANQQMWLQRLLNHANAMVCIRDQEGRYLMMNQMAEKILGLRPGSSIGLTDAMLEQPGWLDFQRETDEVMLRDGECPMSIQLIELMSGPVRLAVTKNLIQDELGNVMGSVLIGGIL
ncbi:PAS domain-containing protein, partial [Thalassolituus sp.]